MILKEGGGGIFKKTYTLHGVSNSQAKIDENFANFFFKPKLTISALSAKMSMQRATEKSELEP